MIGVGMLDPIRAHDQKIDSLKSFDGLCLGPTLLVERGQAAAISEPVRRELLAGPLEGCPVQISDQNGHAEIAEIRSIVPTDERSPVIRVQDQR